MEVQLISFTAEADAVCDLAARVCTSSAVPVLGKDKEYKALRSALASGHTSIAEFAQFTFLITGVDRVTEIQLTRHRHGSYAIQSGRFCSRDPTNYNIPFPTTGEESRAIERFNDSLKELDDALKASGRPAEDRRYFYPQGLKTNIMLSMNGRALLDTFFPRRCCSRAQGGIREMADKMLELCKEVAPVLFEDAGSYCIRYGRCDEKKCCGKTYEYNRSE